MLHLLQSSLLCRSAPGSTESKASSELERVTDANSEHSAYIGQMTIGSSPRRFRSFRCHNVPRLRSNQSVCDEKRISTDLQYFVVGEVTRIPIRYGTRNQLYINFIRHDDGISHRTIS